MPKTSLPRLIFARECFSGGHRTLSLGQRGGAIDIRGSGSARGESLLD
jgi:hypothetical protein